MRRGLTIALIVVAALVILGGAYAAFAVYRNQNPTPAPTPTVVPTHIPTATHTATATLSATPTVKPTATPTGKPSAFMVKSVALVVSPASIAGKKCGTKITFTYTAQFNVTVLSSGGAITFTYTTTNGRSTSPPLTLIVKGGIGSVRYIFSSSGTMTSDHTFPTFAQVAVSKPNAVKSVQVKPVGACR